MNEGKRAQITRPEVPSEDTAVAKKQVSRFNAMRSKIGGFLRGQRQTGMRLEKQVHKKRYRPLSIRDEVTEFLGFCDEQYKRNNMKIDKTTVIHMIWIARAYAKIKNIRGRQKEAFLTAVRREIHDVNRELYAT